MTSGSEPRRRIPRTDTILADPAIAEAIERLGPAIVKDAVRRAQRETRAGVADADSVLERTIAALPATASSLRPILNATGVVLHTNLGRAPLSAAAVDAVVRSAGYVDVEYDHETGARTTRGLAVLQALVRRVPAAEDALVVNNGAAALVLAATALAGGREIILSRGEMVEIGAGFRLPDLIISTGARIREVGTTNRTSRADYADAVGPDTGLILKVHPSNFVVRGFVSSVPIAELTGLGVPLVADIGSGLLEPDPVLPDEPDVASWLEQGADLVTASGDKLLGGPQAGLLLGRAELVEQLRRHPLARALRVDKLALAALEATITGPSTPTYRYVHADPQALHRRVDALVAALDDAGVESRAVPSAGMVGGGGAPDIVLSGWAVELPSRYAKALRAGDPCVVARVERGATLLDPRCIDPGDDRRLLAAVLMAGGSTAGSRSAPRCT